MIEGIESCPMCEGGHRSLETAPGGALVCPTCNELTKHLNLARLRGMSDEQILDAFRKGLEDYQKGQDND